MIINIDFLRFERRVEKSGKWLLFLWFDYVFRIGVDGEWI